ncbi:PREDICTED: uncharacterized protein LOC107604599 [Ficedula albicollis]|uniref:uncharacterized protein LOC107604599 n=1 Tax=Ficedula albicollis TaxID=59894 RepID=UPI0007AD7B8D|nr:PREDICTED: uncharacterized protein LOC107604599 [Ficedula albicollis]
MGTIASAVEKATVNGLMTVLNRTEEKIKRSDLVALLLWCRRHGYFQDPGSVFDEKVRKNIGTEMWESIQSGSKGAKDCALTYRAVRAGLRQVAAEAEVVQAAKDKLLCPAQVTQREDKEKDEESEEEKEDDDPASRDIKCLALPVKKGPYDDLIPPFELQPAPAVVPSAPPQPMDIDPAKVPLPPDHANPLEEMRMDINNLSDHMQTLLKEMARMDPKASKEARERAYQKAADAIKDAKSFERSARNLGE